MTILVVRDRIVKWLFMLGFLSLSFPLGLVWAGESGVPYPPGWRWGIDPTPYRRPQPSLLGTTGYFDLPTSESLRQGNFAMGLFGAFEHVFKTHLNDGNDLARLDLERYSLTLSGAYGILDSLEIGLTVPGLTTAAEFKQSVAGDVRSGDVHDEGFGKVRIGLKYHPAALDFSSLRPIGFAGPALEPFVAIQTHGTEQGLSYPSRDQDSVYGINLLMGGQAGPIGINWRLGYSRTDGSNVDNFLVIGSPFNLDADGFSDAERLSYTLACNFQPGPPLNLIVKGDGDTSARHPWETSQDWQLNVLAGAIYGLPNGLAVHAGWQVDLHDPIPGGSVDEATQKLQDAPRLTAEIEGHTDSIGTELYNLGLAQRRAEVVKGYLVLRHQVEASRMTTASYGESRPIADNRTAEGRALNRRVEFKVIVG